MFNTKRILIEGLPGAGKYTSTNYLQNILSKHGFDCRGFLEEDRPLPKDCLDFEIRGLSKKVTPLWGNYMKQAGPEATINIMKSRLWQRTGLYMDMSEGDEQEIVRFTHQVYQVIRPLSPILI